MSTAVGFLRARVGDGIDTVKLEFRVALARVMGGNAIYA